jgi:hypothetical protein
MEKSLTFADNDAFYKQLLDLESQKEEYLIDTGIMEAKNLPLRLVHHVGLTKDEIAHVQRKTVEEPAWRAEIVEPMLIKFNEMIGKYRLARDYEFTVEAQDFDNIKIHGRPKTAAPASV